MHDAREYAMKEKILFNFYTSNYPNCQYDFVTAAEIPDKPDSKSDRELAMIRSRLFTVSQEIDGRGCEEIMRDYFEILEESRPVSRWATFVLFAAGVAALAVPTIDTLYRVTEILIGRFS